METETKKDECENCGEAFECRASSGDCWCFEMSVPAETLDILKENFTSCLCRKCLEKLQTAEAKEQAF